MKKATKKKIEDYEDLARPYVKYFLLCAALLLIFIFRVQIVEFIIKVPVISHIYLFIFNGFSRGSLLGLFLISFLGALFFISLPFEIVLIYYFSLEQHITAVLALAVLGNVLGIYLDYLVGYAIGKRATERLWKDEYTKFHSHLKKTGPYVLLIGNMVPFPIELVAIVYGAVHYPTRYFLFYTVIGRILKVLIIFILYYYISAAIPLIGAIFSASSAVVS